MVYSQSRAERGNAVRFINMSGAPPGANRPHTNLGYSVGRGMGDVLTIETTHMAHRGLELDERSQGS